MNAKSCGFVPRRLFRLIRMGTLLAVIGAAYGAGADDAKDRFRSGLRAESRLDIFGAREHFRAALRSQPRLPGLREHTAWFLYLNGFHDRECLGLFEECLPAATNRHATANAISHVRQQIGLIPPVSRPPVARPRTTPPDSDLPARLQHARELFWSGSPQAAQAELESLIAEKPDEAALRWELAKVLSARTEYAAASEQLAVARRLRPNEPEIALDQGTAEALLGNRTTALRMIDGMIFPDEALACLVRARAYHYSGEFIPAAREYQRVLATRPYHEIAAHGLAECSLRNNAVPEARQLLATWPAMCQVTNWNDRIRLEREVAAPRVRAGFSHTRNSLDYENWNVGMDFRFRPRPELQFELMTTGGWFMQDGFSTIDRLTGQFTALYQESDFWALSGFIGLNDYSNGWTSATGGLGIMFRPFSSLELNLGVSHIDIVDSEPPLGISIYDLASTIGAVGGRATMDAFTITASWTPVERLELFGKYRIAELSGDNTLNEAYFNIAYVVMRDPFVRVGYGIAYSHVADPSPVYTEDGHSTSYYYDPDDMIVNNLYVEFSQNIGPDFSYGFEAHLYHQPDSGGIGTGLFAYARYQWADNQAVRIDARYFTQDHGLNRDNSSSGSYDAFNLVAIYEYRF